MDVPDASFLLNTRELLRLNELADKVTDEARLAKTLKQRSRLQAISNDMRSVALEIAEAVFKLQQETPFWREQSHG